MRDSTIIYRSFYEAIIELPKESQAEVWEAICEYSFNFKEIELTGINKTIFKLIKPQLEANNRKYKNGVKGGEHGTKGGRPKAEKTPKEPQGNPTETPNDNGNDNDNGNVVDLTEDFETFWKAYPKHTKKNDARAEWSRTRPSLEEILTALKWQKNLVGWTEHDGKYVSTAAQYLEDERYLDKKPRAYNPH